MYLIYYKSHQLNPSRGVAGVEGQEDARVEPVASPPASTRGGTRGKEFEFKF